MVGRTLDRSLSKRYKELLACLRLFASNSRPINPNLIQSTLALIHSHLTLHAYGDNDQTRAVWSALDVAN